MHAHLHTRVSRHAWNTHKNIPMNVQTITSNWSYAPETSCILHMTQTHYSDWYPFTVLRRSAFKHQCLCIPEMQCKKANFPYRLCSLADVRIIRTVLLRVGDEQDSCFWLLLVHASYSITHCQHHSST